MKRRTIVAANWKMNGDLALINSMTDALQSVELQDGVDVVICPSFPFLAAFSLKQEQLCENIYLGAQNASEHVSGAFTGEISTDMLKSVGTKYTILGHSERREYHNETSETVKLKAINALKNKLNVIICVGESLSQKKNKKTLRIIGDQLKKSLPDNISSNNLFVAYEPIWAIGSGLIPKNEDILKVHKFISKKLIEKYGAKGKKIKILYGGSVSKKNAEDILSIDHVNGALIGGASLKYKDFKSILDFCD